MLFFRFFRWISNRRSFFVHTDRSVEKSTPTFLNDKDIFTKIICSALKMLFYLNWIYFLLSQKFIIDKLKSNLLLPKNWIFINWKINKNIWALFIHWGDCWIVTPLFHNTLLIMDLDYYLLRPERICSLIGWFFDFKTASGVA